ncbi:extracellular solute-binding protein [Paenibacillus sp. H1-7]|uniref:extracellular solute-binding protein n=1 Tax=Paenibacillus sp. H1-7 TaxID=2282849 RepID=UPI001EF964D3|nr:extracellular solute-binding protein [Paenibacillus sp. H1-7]ULL16848.1 extracellular solute-binding protein [Paenibacillus sp. H1-7]
MNKKLYAGLSVCLASSIVVSACSDSQQNSASPDANNGTASGGPVTVTIFAPQDPNTDYMTNTFTKLVEEKLNMKIQWTVTPYDAAKEKRKLAISSGDYPDAFMSQSWVDSFSPSELMKFGQQGVLVPLNKLIDEHAPVLKKNMEAIPYLKSAVTAPDGNIYGLPPVNECYHCSFPSKMWINTGWLQKLGLAMPKTTDEFKKVLQAFKTQDPNGNGKQDEIPLSGANETYGTHVTAFLMNAFVYNDDSTYLDVQNGKLNVAAMQPQWKEGLKYMASLYKEGLIDPGAFTQNADAFKQLGNRTDMTLLGAGAGMHPAIFIDIAGNPQQQNYDPVPPLTGPQGVKFATTTPFIDGFTFVITNKASKEKQAALIKLADYLASEEGTTLATMGEKGVNWDVASANDKGLDGQPAKYVPVQRPKGEKPLNNKWGEIGSFLKTKDYRSSWAAPMDIKDAAGYERRLHEATKLYDGSQPKEVLPKIIYLDEAANTEASLMKTNIKKYVEENMLQFITGAKDIDSSWEAYLAGFKNLNVERFLQIYQQAYDKMKK